MEKKTGAHKYNLTAKTTQKVPSTTVIKCNGGMNRERMKTHGAERGLNKALRQWDHPHEGTTCHRGTSVPSGLGVYFLLLLLLLKGLTLMEYTNTSRVSRYSKCIASRCTTGGLVGDYLI